MKYKVLVNRKIRKECENIMELLDTLNELAYEEFNKMCEGYKSKKELEKDSDVTIKYGDTADTLKISAICDMFLKKFVILNTSIIKTVFNCLDMEIYHMIEKSDDALFAEMLDYADGSRGDYEIHRDDDKSGLNDFIEMRTFSETKQILWNNINGFEEMLVYAYDPDEGR